MEQYIMIPIALICFGLAFAFKMAIKNDRAHDFIPLGCAILGTGLAIAFLGVNLENIATGVVSGLAATGIWEQIIHILPQMRTADGEVIDA